MTNNQINYWRLQEDARHNVVSEKESNRHNIATEKQSVTELREQIRHNKASEKLTKYSIKKSASTSLAAARISAAAHVTSARTSAAATLGAASTSAAAAKYGADQNLKSTYVNSGTTLQKTIGDNAAKVKIARIQSATSKSNVKSQNRTSIATSVIGSIGRIAGNAVPRK